MARRQNQDYYQGTSYKQKNIYKCFINEIQYIKLQSTVSFNVRPLEENVESFWGEWRIVYIIGIHRFCPQIGQLAIHLLACGLYTVSQI